MNLSKLLQFLKQLDVQVDYASEHAENIGAFCPLAKWTHRSGTSSKSSFTLSHHPTRVTLCKCWACGFSGTIYDLCKALSYYQGDDYRRWVSILNELESPSLEDLLEASAIADLPKKQAEKLPEDTLDKKFPQKVSRWRNLSEQTLAKFNVRNDTKSKRVIVPIYDTYGNLVGATGRTYADQMPKWKNYFNFRKTSCVLYSDYLKNQALIVTEGQVDCMRVYDSLACGSFDVCAILGSSPSAMQLDLMEPYEEVVVFMDNDGSGRRGEQKIVHGLVERGVRKVSIAMNYSIENPDPGSLDASSVKKCIEKRLTVALTY